MVKQLWGVELQVAPAGREAHHLHNHLLPILTSFSFSFLPRGVGRSKEGGGMAASEDRNIKGTTEITKRHRQQINTYRTINDKYTEHTEHTGSGSHTEISPGLTI